MPGKKSVSEAAAAGTEAARPRSRSGVDWRCVAVEETGGYAGLRRGTMVERSEVAPPAAERICRLLGTIRRSRRGLTDDPPTAGVSGPAVVAPHAAGPMSDAQTLQLEVRTRAGAWTRRYDTADLPPSVAELVDLLPAVRPLPHD